MKIKKFNEYHKINEVSGGYMGPLGRFGIPGVKDIKDILKGTTLRTILSYEPPKRIAVSSPEKNILEKKRKILKKYNCPENWYKKKITMDEFKEWCKNNK